MAGIITLIGKKGGEVKLPVGSLRVLHMRGSNRGEEHDIIVSSLPGAVLHDDDAFVSWHSPSLDIVKLPTKTRRTLVSIKFKSGERAHLLPTDVNRPIRYGSRNFVAADVVEE